ncbi:MAG: NrpR regulatory domain-containing protein [Dehalococcoidales bacterium]
MTNQAVSDVEHKVIAILQVLKDSSEPMGSTLIGRKLRDSGIDANERTIRNHLRILDERGFTKLVSRRQGRLVTQLGLHELDNALIGDRVGSAITKIEMLIYQTSFEPEKSAGQVPVNVSLFPADKFKKCLEIMKGICTTHICASELVCVAGEGERLGEVKIPPGKVGLATLSNIAVSAVLIKMGIPVDFRFGGLLQVRKNNCIRFVDLIEYTGSSINPYEVFIASKMTDLNGVRQDGNGKMLASFNEIPALARTKVETIIKGLERLGISGIITIGRAGEPLCETPVKSGKFGLVLADGLNLAAAVAETGIEVENHAVCGTIDFTSMRPLSSPTLIPR